MPRGTDLRFLLPAVRVSGVDGDGAQRYDQHDDNHNHAATAFPVARVQGIGDEAGLPDPGQGVPGRRNRGRDQRSVHALLMRRRWPDEVRTEGMQSGTYAAADDRRGGVPKEMKRLGDIVGGAYERTRVRERESVRD